MERKAMKREIISGSPSEEYDNSSGENSNIIETDYVRVDHREESLIEETNEYRIIEITEHGYEGHGVAGIDASGSFGGGSGWPFTNTYRVKEWFSRE